MPKQEYLGENQQALLTFFQESSNAHLFIRDVAVSFLEGRDTYEIPPLTLLNSILSEQEHNAGALEFYVGEEKKKYFFRPTTQEEIQKTQALLTQGITGLVPYEGQFSLPGEKVYGFGSLDAASINLATVKLQEQEEEDYFNTFDVLSCAAQLMASIHKRGLIFNKFMVGNIVITPDSQNPLLLYDTSEVMPISPHSTREKDIQDFLTSLERSNPSSIHTGHKQYFNDRYKTSF